MRRKAMVSKVDLTLADDLESVVMTLSSDDESVEAVKVALSAEQVTSLLQVLGRVRETMLKDKAVPPIEGARFSAVSRTRWALQPEVVTGGSVLAFQHPAYGPVGLVLTPNDSEKLVRGLQIHHGLRVEGRPDDRKLN
ncbi:hypothetical protein HK11_00375 [Acetobacter sp. DmW_043]|nr:hypothetical protein HK11_00375 [Acetobacter sp. DmW_043]